MSPGISVSPKKGLHVTAKRVRALLLRLEAAWLRCADSRPIVYIVFAVLYGVPNLVLAHRKLIWTDEFFTLYLSKTKDWSELCRALSTGADQHPPTFYYLTHLIFELAGTTHITLRLAPLLGFGLFCVCLCEIARRVVGRRWAPVALLLPLTTPDLDHAADGRGYGIELGFVTFSLLMWILASDGKKRAWTVPALAVGLCLSVASHYYAVLLLIPLVAGELVKAKLRQRIDFPVCSAFMAALIPLVLFAPIILKAKTYSTLFWAMPHWGQMLSWYPQSTGYMILVFFAASGLIFVLRIPANHDSPKVASPLGAPVVVALAATALLPVVGMVIAQFITHAFANRYFIAALPGTCIVALWGVKRIMRNVTAGPFLISILCVLIFVEEWRLLNSYQVASLMDLRSVATLLRHTGDAPIVVADNLAFQQLSFYGQRDLVNKLVWAADPHLSVRYLGFNTIDRSLLALAPWFPVKVMWWHEWWGTHPFSLVYGDSGKWDWSTYTLNNVGRVQLLKRLDNDGLLLGVTRTHVPEDDRTPSDPSGKPTLYDQLPADGPPLCKIYMPTETCPIIDDPNLTGPVITNPNLR
jgi:hypothetical protein